MSGLPDCLKAALVEVLENDAQAERVLELAAPYVKKRLKNWKARAIHAEAALRALRETLKEGPRIQHKVRGSTYRVTGTPEFQLSTLPFRTVKEGQRITVYRCETTGKQWCRFPDEMVDGRFEDLPSLVAP